MRVIIREAAYMISIGYMNGLQKIGRARQIQYSIGFLKAPKGLGTFLTWAMLADFPAGAITRPV